MPSSSKPKKITTKTARPATIQRDAEGRFRDVPAAGVNGLFVLLFGYVFGSSIKIPGVNYREYLIAGVFAQTVIFGATGTGAGMAEDMTKGIVDRFRSLPCIAAR